MKFQTKILGFFKFIFTNRRNYKMFFMSNNTIFQIIHEAYLERRFRCLYDLGRAVGKLLSAEMSPLTNADNRIWRNSPSHWN